MRWHLWWWWVSVLHPVSSVPLDQNQSFFFLQKTFTTYVTLTIAVRHSCVAPYFRFWYSTFTSFPIIFRSEYKTHLHTLPQQHWLLFPMQQQCNQNCLRPNTTYSSPQWWIYLWFCAPLDFSSIVDIRVLWLLLSPHPCLMLDTNLSAMLTSTLNIKMVPGPVRFVEVNANPFVCPRHHGL